MLNEKSHNLEKLEDRKQGRKKQITNKFKYVEYPSYYGDKNDIWNRKEESG